MSERLVDIDALALRSGEAAWMEAVLDLAEQHRSNFVRVDQIRAEGLLVADALGGAVRDDGAVVEAVREAVGPDVEVSVDAGCRLDLPSAVDLARRRGLRVLSARGSGAEMRLSFTAPVDLFDEVDVLAWPTVPAPAPPLPHPSASTALPRPLPCGRAPPRGSPRPRPTGAPRPPA